MTQGSAARRWRVVIDHNRCIGAGSCQALSPRHFALDDDYRSRAPSEVIDADDQALAAARACPTEAIRLEALETGELVYPEP